MRVDTESGRRRPRQVGTYPSRRSAQAAASAFTAAGEVAPERETVGHLVDQWVAGKVDVSNKSRLQYEWAAGHIRAGIGGVRVDRLERDGVALWLESLASEGQLSRRSIQIMRMVLRAALDDAVAIGELRRSPASRVGMPRNVAKTSRELDRTARIERALVEVHGRPEWTAGKNARSRRTIPIDKSVVAALKAHRRFQAEERLVAGADWQDHGLVVATRHGRPVSPGNFDQTLERLVGRAGVTRLTSHGLRHTAATHMVRHASDLGEIRAAADILGHSPDMLMRTYAHVMPESIRTVTDKIEQRSSGI